LNAQDSAESADGWEEDLKVPLTDLRRRPRAKRAISLSTHIDGLRVSDTEIDPLAPVEIDATLEALPEGVAVTGHIAARWVGPCHLCLLSVGGRLDVDVHELYADDPMDEEVYRLHREYVDLAPLVGDALQLELPLFARCPNGGVGLCESAPDLGVLDEAADPERPGRDPRWNVLDNLSFE